MLFTIIGIVIILFGFVLLFGAPYVPTLRRETDKALDMLNLKEGQTLYELGCGDGRVLKRAAERGLNGVGIELNPILVLAARINTWKYRRQIRIKWGNFWKADISKADGIFVFLLDKFMARLDKKVEKEAGKPLSLISFAFKIPDKKPTQVNNGLYMYSYKK